MRNSTYLGGRNSTYLGVRNSTYLGGRKSDVLAAYTFVSGSVALIDNRNPL